jgi:acetylornithine deacetylase
MRWGANALALVEAESASRFGGLTGLRFNIGRVEGGIKANVIAPGAEVRFGFRPLPSQDTDALHARFGACAAPGALERYAETFRGPPLPAGDIATAEECRLAARDLADELGLPIGSAVDFWTEASLFSQAGMTAFVYGPGDIAQAHAADEWVELEQLRRYADSIARILGGTLP